LRRVSRASDLGNRPGDQTASGSAPGAELHPWTYGL